MEMTINKLDHLSQRVVLSYSGRVIESSPRHRVIEAYFQRADVPLPYVTFRTGDRLIEYFYTERWYNIFELYDVVGGHLKGWYCNITRPAVFTERSIQWADLALDVWVSPLGDVLVLDEDEFEALKPDDQLRQQALSAVADLHARVARGDPPFAISIG